MIGRECPVCGGKRLKKQALSVKFEGLDIAQMSRQPLQVLQDLFGPYADQLGGIIQVGILWKNSWLPSGSQLTCIHA